MARLTTFVAITILAAAATTAILIFPPSPSEISTTTTEMATSTVVKVEELKPKPAPTTASPTPTSPAATTPVQPMSLPTYVPPEYVPPAYVPPAYVPPETVKVPEAPPASLMKAVVRIRCGKIFGSGFVLNFNGKKYALTAGHVVIDRIEAKIFNCDVIFPREDENKNFAEAHYRVGKILSPKETEKKYKEKGIDLAILEVMPLENPQEDAAIFPSGYPFIDYPFCPPDNLNDQILLWGYAANVGTAATPGAFISQFAGNIIQYADVTGVSKEFSPEFAGGYAYYPTLKDSMDSKIQHHLTIIVSNNNFSGASGGLVFDTAKNCVVGVNIATLVQNNNVFGFVTNPNFEPIKDFVERAFDIKL